MPVGANTEAANLAYGNFEKFFKKIEYVFKILSWLLVAEAIRIAAEKIHSTPLKIIYFILTILIAAVIANSANIFIDFFAPGAKGSSNTTKAIVVFLAILVFAGLAAFDVFIQLQVDAFLSARC